MIGETVGRYRIDSLLGEGGMGKVYKAYDASLGRAAALKMLPDDVVHDADRLERFTREARTASALNHPNVVTIYEVGGADGKHFIAMELVEGETLRQRLMRGRMELPRALELIAQVADGVATAHAAGIIHRDLKPENIVIAKNGFAKILDFGLAKLPALPVDDTATAVKGTTPGLILGTVGYMAPEQARGEAVDHRADLFSLGCILYEAIGGRRAFHGDSSVDTLHQILYSDPQSLAEAVPDTPAEVQRIVRKCLAKDPDQRYQSAKDIAIDLRNAKREIESQPPARAVVAGALRTPSPWRWIAGLVIVALLAAVAVLLMRRGDVTTKPPETAEMSITRLTTSGNVIGAAISPDGQYLVYAYSDAARHSLWARQIETANAQQIVPPSRGGFWGVGFSPDSRLIYYGFKSSTDPSGALFQTPILGAQPRRLLNGIDSHVHFSPDGRRMLFVRNHVPKPGQSALVIANADGSEQRVLLGKAPPESLVLFWGAPDWTADGRSVIVPVLNGRSSRLYIADAATGTMKPFSKDEWQNLGDVKCLRNGDVLVIGSASRGSAQIWLVSRDGSRKQITNDLLAYRIVSLTADESKLVSVVADVTSAIWKVSLDGTHPPVKLTSGRYDGLRGTAAAEDGTVYFTTNDGGRLDIWSIDPHGERRQVTNGEFPSQTVAISPDQKYLITTMPRQNDWVLVRLNRDGSGMKVLCPVVNARDARVKISVTPDSRVVYFDSAMGGVDRVWKVSIDGGEATPIADGDSPVVSPDGSMIAYVAIPNIRIAKPDGTRVRDFEKFSVTNYSMVRWAPDGKGLFHNGAVDDRTNIWYQPLDGSDPRKITGFDDEYAHNFDVTPDGKDLIVTRGVLSRDAVLIRNFR